jgi:hypothetical protein
MSLANRLKLQGLCNQIEELVKSEDLDFGYNQGGVRVSVMSGKKADAHGKFIEAEMAFLSALRTATGDVLAEAKDAFAEAFGVYAKEMGY